MKTTKTALLTAMAMMVMLTFSQCKQAPQTQSAPVKGDTAVSVSTPALRVAYVDIDTLLTNYNLWKELNEEMIRKEENIRATLNEKAKELQKDFEDFDRKLNNNGFSTRERAESEQNRILKKRQDLEALQERLTNELQLENNKNSMLFRDSINSYIRDYNKVQGYNIILSRMGDNILYIDADKNITYEVLKGLNERYQPENK